MKPQKRLKKKNEKRASDADKKRDQARLNYPVDVRIYLADKYKSKAPDQIQGE